MDIWKALYELHLERQRLDKAIRTLEGLIASGPSKPKSKRGRKSMPAHERRLVSERMRKYWEARRAQQQQTSSPVA